MNFRERFNLNINNNINYEHYETEVKTESFSFDMFCRNSEVEKILRTTFIKDKNVIIASKKDSNKDIIYSYIKKFIGKAQSVDVIEKIEDDITFTNASKIIVPEPSIYEIVKILEFILCDYKSFIFSLNIKSYESIIESIKTLILLNFPNLSNQNVQHLIGSTQAIVIYVSIDERSNYHITNIGEIEYKDGKIFLNNLYDKEKNEKALLEDYGDLAEISEKEELLEQNVLNAAISEKNNKQEDIEEKEEPETETLPSKKNEENKISEEEDIAIKESESEVTEKEVKEEFSEEQEEIQTKETTEEETVETIETEEEIKINKYKQLREKLRKRKALEK